MADKYTQAEIDALGAKGHAFKNPDGHYGYPVDDEEDLGNAIKAVGRGGADHDAIRKYIIGRAKAMGKSASIPDNWQADGSLAESKSAVRAALELRKRRRNSMVRQLERRRMPFARGKVELRAKPDGTGGTTYEFEGYGAVFDTPFDMWDPWGDPYVEVVRPGAFTQTLAQQDLDVPFLVGHNEAGIPLARTRSGTMQLAQDSTGLHVQATLDGRSSQARDLAVAVERGDMDEMSIGFVTMPGGQSWSPDWMQRDMLNLDLHRGDVSAVALGANAATAGSRVIALSSGRPAERRRPGQKRMPTAPYTVHPGEDYACPQCQSANDRDAYFCDQCGAKMPGGPAGAASAEGEDETQQCQSCLHMNATDAKYCDQCGTELAGVTPWRTPGGGYSWDDGWKSGRPKETAGAPRVDVSDTPDYNPGAVDVDEDGTHAPMTGTHKHDHAAYGAKGHGGHAHAHVADASHEHDHQYNADGTIVLDDSGVVEEVGGAMADADLLSRRLRLLELA